MIYDITGDSVVLRVRLQPNSTGCRFMNVFTDAQGQEFLKVAVVSVPEKGRANKELIAVLAKYLGVAKSQIQIISGEFDRYKKVRLEGNVAEISKALDDLVKGKDCGCANH